MRLSATRTFLVLILPAVLLTTIPAKAAAVEYESVVGVDGFLWDKPGYTWYDCQTAAKAAETLKAKAKKKFKTHVRTEIENVCDGGRRELIQSGETVDHVLKNGKPQVIVKKIKIGNTTSVQKFYLVKSPTTGRTGWMSSSYIRNPIVKEFEAPPATPPVADEPAQPTQAATAAPVKPCNCNPRPTEPKQHIENLRKDAAAIEAAVSKMAIGAVKSPEELDRYMCLNRDLEVSQSTFNKLLPEIRKSAAAAEKAFGIPAPILKCVMLVESALVSNAKSEKNAAGLLQALEGTVDQLITVSERAPLDAEWNKYKSMQPAARLSQSTLRLRSNVTSSMGGIGLYLRHLQEDYIKKSCKSCSVEDGMLTRKEIYLMIVGYNAGPGGIPKVSRLSAGQMLRSKPPPKETRNYFTKIDQCLQAHKEHEKPHPKLLKECDAKFPPRS